MISSGLPLHRLLGAVRDEVPVDGVVRPDDTAPDHGLTLRESDAERFLRF